MWSLRWHFTNRSITGAPYNVKVTVCEISGHFGEDYADWNSSVFRSRRNWWRRTNRQQKCMYVGNVTVVCWWNKKLIRRWDSERELSLRRHRTPTTEYKRLVHKFRHGYALESIFTKFIEIMQCNGHYAVQGHRFWYQSKAHIRLPITD